ncbi:hypothetical protein INT47_003103 [Mucor saturninus]|uniref:Uncharacterized protein n=1 Tax=Mucor saturninus TaxID=64648 RepID=A0A8H7QHI3_9FUNG|nr:hypothetical protein INT47_003103 [Mucor saturninus]
MSSSSRNSNRRSNANEQPGSSSQGAGNQPKRRRLAPRSETVRNDDEGYKELSGQMASMSRQLRKMYDMQASSANAVSMFMNAHANGVFNGAPAGPVLPATISPSVPAQPSLSESQMSAIILDLIHEKMWIRDLKSNDPIEIAENEARRKWNTDQWIDHQDNVKIVKYLREYILSQPRAAGFWPSMVVAKIKNNYKTFYRSVNMSEEAGIIKKHNARINSRMREILNRRIITYETNWEIIDAEMGPKEGNAHEMAYLNVLRKEVMSDGESGVEDFGEGVSLKVVKIACPSWRSDELNRLLAIIDRISKDRDLRKGQSKSKPKTPRIQRGVKVVPVPTSLSTILPPWSIRDE